MPEIRNFDLVVEILASSRRELIIEGVYIYFSTTDEFVTSFCIQKGAVFARNKCTVTLEWLYRLFQNRRTVYSETTYHINKHYYMPYTTYNNE